MSIIMYFICLNVHGFSYWCDIHAFFIDVFPSTFVEDQPIRILIGIFEAFHASVRESMFSNIATSTLL